MIVRFLQQFEGHTYLDQEIPGETLQRCPILLAELNRDLLVVPIMPSVVVRDKVVCQLVTVREEPAIQSSQPALQRTKLWCMQRDEPCQIEEQTAAEVESHGIGCLVKEDVDGCRVDLENTSQAEDEGKEAVQLWLEFRGRHSLITAVVDVNMSTVEWD